MRVGGDTQTRYHKLLKKTVKEIGYNVLSCWTTGFHRPL